jgi:hypothetical protein
MHGIMPADKRKLHQPGAPDSSCTVCSDYTPQGAQLGKYVLPLSSFAISVHRQQPARCQMRDCAPSPPVAASGIVRASSRSPFFRPTNERFSPL